MRSATDVAVAGVVDLRDDPQLGLIDRQRLIVAGCAEVVAVPIDARGVGVAASVERRSVPRHGPSHTCRQPPELLLATCPLNGVQPVEGEGETGSDRETRHLTGHRSPCHARPCRAPHACFR